MDASDTIGSLKHRIMKEHGYKTENQVLRFQSEKLSDETKTLRQYHIKNESTIHLMLKSSKG